MVVKCRACQQREWPKQKRWCHKHGTVGRGDILGLDVAGADKDRYHGMGEAVKDVVLEVLEC